MFAKESKDASTHTLKVKIVDLYSYILKCLLTYQYLVEVASRLKKLVYRIAQRATSVFSPTHKTKSTTIH